MNIFVPGRICLLGEHTDWAGGYRRINGKLKKGLAIVVGTNQGIYAKVKPHPNKLIITSTITSGEKREPFELPMKLDHLEKIAKSDNVFSYIAGVAYQVLTHYNVGGLIIDNYYTDLPFKKGLSSSAAISVLVARAFNRIYNLKMTIRGEMEFAYRGESTTLSRCGRMDQGCAYGNNPIMMTFDGDQLYIKQLEINNNFHFVIVDLKGQKDTIKILTKLNQCFPFQENATQEKVKHFLCEISESITEKAAAALQAGDAVGLGKLMCLAQEEFDRYCIPACPEELRAPLLHKLLNYKPLSPFILGGKGVGSQGDGSAQLLVRNESDQNKVISIIGNELGMSCLKLTIQNNKCAEREVAPVSEFDTDFLPVPQVIDKKRKPQFIIFDIDGVMTTGQFLYSENGKAYKIFGAHDNDGIKLLNNKCKIIFLTADKRGFLISKKRIVDDMRQELYLVGEGERLSFIEKNYGLSNAIYMGDGLYDAEILKNCFYGIAPRNATAEAKRNAAYITRVNSGEGAVLDACLHILKKFFRTEYNEIFKRPLFTRFLLPRIFSLDSKRYRESSVLVGEK